MRRSVYGCSLHNTGYAKEREKEWMYDAAASSVLPADETIIG